MKISAIVPVWNGRELLARLLATLEAQSLPVAEVLIVDNGSTDGAPEMALARGARVIAMGRNAGFAAAVNRGIREAAHPLLAILNSDVELAPDYLEKLAAAGAPFATGKILSPGGLLDGTFDMTCRGGTTWRCGAGQPDGPPFDQAREIHSPPWTAVLYRAEVFERVGMLEESFESYLEDADFGLRCATVGIVGRYLPEARATHVGSASLGALARGDRKAHVAESTAAGRPALGRPVLVARGGGAGALGRGRSTPRVRSGLGSRQVAGNLRLRCCPKASSSPEGAALEKIFRHNERFICITSSDRYWKLYFQLTGGAK